MEGRRPSHTFPELGWRPSPRSESLASVAQLVEGRLDDGHPNEERRRSDAALEMSPIRQTLPPGKAGTLVIGTGRGPEGFSQFSPISWGSLTPLPSAPISDSEGSGLLGRPPNGFDRAQEASSSAPESPTPVEPPTQSPPPSSPDSEGPLSVLIVDDDPLTRKLMTRMLQRLGHKVIGTAENGAAALALIKASFEGVPDAHKIDMVFLDK